MVAATVGAAVLAGSSTLHRLAVATRATAEVVKAAAARWLQVFGPWSPEGLFVDRMEHAHALSSLPSRLACMIFDAPTYA